MATSGPPAGPPTVVGLEQAARKLGAWCWAERRLFEVLGGWVRETPEPALKQLFATHSRHHAWRAERWAEILPTAYVPVMAALVVAPVEAEVFERLVAVGPSGNRVSAHYDVVYRELLAAYEASPLVMNTVTDGPALRAIRIIVGDAAHDLVEAEMISSRLPGGISGPVHLTQLREALAKTQVSEASVGHSTYAFRRWGS